MSRTEERFAGAGSERTPLNLPDPYAYLVGANDRWDSLWHIMNMDTMPMSVSIKYTIGYQKNATGVNSRSVTPFFAGATGCGASVFNVPGDGGMGSAYTKAHYDMPMAEMFATAADMGMMDPPTQIDPCPAHNIVTAGNTYSLTARYDNSQPYTDVMGIALAYIWRGHQWRAVPGQPRLTASIACTFSHVEKRSSSISSLASTNASTVASSIRPAPGMASGMRSIGVTK